MSTVGAEARDESGWTLSSKQVMTAGLLLTALVVLAQTASQWIDFSFFHLRLRLLDSDHHKSIFGALSILAQGVAAVAIGMRAASMRRGAGLVVAAVLAVLTVPRALIKYEPAFERYDAAVLVAPFAVVLVALLALTFGDARRIRYMVWGSLVFLACAFALHAVGPQADNGTTTYTAAQTWSYQLTGMLKHGAELAGWMLLTTGMIASRLAAFQRPRRRDTAIF